MISSTYKCNKLNKLYLSDVINSLRYHGLLAKQWCFKIQTQHWRILLVQMFSQRFSGPIFTKKSVWSLLQKSWTVSLLINVSGHLKQTSCLAHTYFLVKLTPGKHSWKIEKRIFLSWRQFTFSQWFAAKIIIR